jgi:hypothetical protein
VKKLVCTRSYTYILLIRLRKKTSFAIKNRLRTNRRRLSRANASICVNCCPSVCRYVAHYIIIILKYQSTFACIQACIAITLPYFECLSHSRSLGFNLAQEECQENSVKMRNGGRSDRKPSRKLATCLDLATTPTGSPLGLEPKSFTLILKTGNHKG